MIRIDREIDIARPPAIVFDFLSDVGRFPLWLPAIQRAEQVTPGPLAVGASLRIVVRGPTGPTEVTGEITALDRPGLLAVRSTSGPAAVDARCALTPQAGGTHLHLSATIELGGMLRFVEGAARSTIERELPATLADLVRRIEAESPPPAS